MSYCLLNMGKQLQYSTINSQIIHFLSLYTCRSHACILNVHFFLHFSLRENMGSGFESPFHKSLDPLLMSASHFWNSFNFQQLLFSFCRSPSHLDFFLLYEIDFLLGTTVPFSYYLQVIVVDNDHICCLHA